MTLVNTLTTIYMSLMYYIYVCLDYSIDVISGKHYKMPRRIKILYMFQ